MRSIGRSKESVAGAQVGSDALTLTWGTTPLRIEHPTDPSATIEHAIDLVRTSSLVSAGQLVVIVAGSTGPRAGTTDFLRIMRC